MARKNIAVGTDVPVQVGKVHGRSRAETKAAKDTPKDTPAKPADQGKTTTVNIRAGNARVGVQADVITGPLIITHRR